MNTTTSLFDLLSRKEFFDLLIHFQDRENFGKEQLHVIFDDDDELEYIEDDDHNIIEIRHRYFSISITTITLLLLSLSI